jgi:uncharacterized repeat protein (TIGR03803 family)
MKLARFGGYTLSVSIATAMLAGCGGSQPPIGAPDAMPQAVTTQLQSRNDAHKYRVLFDFGNNVYGLDGDGPMAPLIDVNGTLYGTTEYGGTYYFRSNPGAGAVFSVSTSGFNERVLLSFSAEAGGPVAGLVAEGGMLYGTTVGGGRYNGGTVFGVSTAGANGHVLHSFGKGYDGSNPRASLIVLHGKLYGTTYQGGAYGEGTVFSVSVTDGKERVLHSFSFTPDGAGPLAGLIDVSGTLYGTTQSGGANARGTVFSVSTGGSERVLYSFGGPDGETPDANLINVGNTLYGTTAGGGQYGDGTVFSVSMTGTNERVLHSFGTGTDGSQPQAGLTALNGRLYGTTYEGGAAGYGTVFRITASGTKERVLHSFVWDMKDGLNPAAALLDMQGTLYGTTSAGGISLPSCPHSGDLTCDYGTVFALTP